MNDDRDDRSERKFAHRAAADYFTREALVGGDTNEEEYAREQKRY